jgi:hypothetical protein
VVLLPAGALAHPLDVAYLELRQDGAEVRVLLDVGAPLALEEAHLPPEQQNPAGIAASAPELARALLQGSPLLADGAECTWAGTPVASVEGMRIRLSLLARCPRAPAELKWSLPFLQQAPISTRVLGKALAGGHESQFVLDPGRQTLVVTGAPERSFGEFVLMGVQHIGATPGEWLRPGGGLRLPDGIDHILFLLALLLAGGGLLEVLKTVTGFTAGHSVTLALATLGLVRLPSRLVESAIALSIAYVALEDLLVQQPRHRWRLAAGFGLVHGFGFAAALSELQLSRSGLAGALVGFNLGVELGQAVIVALLFPLLALLRRRAGFARYGVRGAAALVFAAGAYWFVQRALL